MSQKSYTGGKEWGLILGSQKLNYKPSPDQGKEEGEREKKKEKKRNQPKKHRLREDLGSKGTGSDGSQKRKLGLH